MLQIDTEKLELLKESNMFGEYLNLKCLIKDENGFNIYIFTIIVENEDELDRIWIALVSDIAVYVQSKLIENIEIWNMYTIFFVKDKISYYTKYKIEEDRYSTRKIVIDNYSTDLSDEKSMDKIINEKLFDFTIQTQEQYSKENISIRNLLLKNDPNLYNIVSENIEDVSKALSKYSGVEI